MLVYFAQIDHITYDPKQSGKYISSWEIWTINTRLKSYLSHLLIGIKKAPICLTTISLVFPIFVFFIYRPFEGKGDKLAAAPKSAV